MLARIAFRNVRRSVRDYGIYFITLVFGVAVFYAFNSIGSQKVLFDAQSMSSDVFDSMDELMGLVSVAIAFVLGFLVVYANRFLIRRRKREFGTYLLLGMRAGQVTVIVLMETVAVGMVSLAVGLAVGAILSQALSLVTAGVFGMTMTQYRFVFSGEALVKTIVCFAIIFAVVALFNTAQVRRCRLITLLSARGANERFRMRNPWASLAVFVVSIVLIVLAYQALMRNGMRMLDDDDFKTATAFMLIGTLLFFWSVSGFVLMLIQRTRGIYFKGLAMFTMRQIASRVNTAFVSLWVVCVLLFLSITIFSTGMGMASMLSGDLEEQTQFDHSLYANTYFMDSEGNDVGSNDQLKEKRALHTKMASANWDTASYMAKRSDEWRNVVGATAQIDIWGIPDLTYGRLADLLGSRIGSDDLSAFNGSKLDEQNVLVIGVSQFNNLRGLAGRDAVSLAADQFAIDNTVDSMDGIARALASSDLSITAGGKTLHPSGTVLRQAVCVEQGPSEMCYLVVPDAVVDNLRSASDALPWLSLLNVNYRQGLDAQKAGDMLRGAIGQVSPVDDEYAELGWVYKSDYWPVSIDLSKQEVIADSMSARVLITYLAVYIGFVLLIATAAVLAIQQLSEASDSIPRYRTLAQLGCDRRMIMRSLRTQILVYFLAPLAVAICHSACALGVMMQTLKAYYNIAPMEYVLSAAVLVLVVYGGYLLVTYFGCRGMVRSSLGKHLLEA